MNPGNKPIWNGFDHRFKAELESSGLATKLQGRRICVALSGGADSVGLLWALWRQKDSLHFTLQAAHFHHGTGKNLEFREQSYLFCKELGENLKLPFFSSQFSGEELHSEADFRHHRWKFLRDLQAQKLTDFVATAHHADDQLETRLLKLIRGCGPTGLEAMRPDEGDVIRPFLKESKSEILQYLGVLDKKFLDDPSNLDPHYYRNWIRQEWLPQLEIHQPGATKALARSLEIISAAFLHQQEVSTQRIWFQGQKEMGLDRVVFSTLSKTQQLQLLVEYLNFLGKHEIRHTQLVELLKILDTPQIVHKFSLLHLYWQINAEQILAHS